jgi:hypothetical protein
MRCMSRLRRPRAAEAYATMLDEGRYLWLMVTTICGY